MTKKEIAELKKLYHKERSCITRICGCYVGAEKEKITSFREAFYALEEFEESAKTAWFLEGNAANAKKIKEMD